MGDNENGKRKSFLWGLFEKTRSGANEIEEDVVQQQTQPVVSSEAVKESAEEEEIFIEAKGAFLDAWKRWQPGEYPRFLSLSGNGHLDGHALHGDKLSLEGLEELAREFVLQATLDEYLIYILTRLDGLDDGTGAEDEFVLVSHMYFIIIF